MAGTTGLSTREAMLTLQGELETLVASHQSTTSPLSWATEAWLPSSPYSLFRVTSLAFGLLLSLALLASKDSVSEVASAAVILALVTTDLALSAWESFLRTTEVRRRVERVVRLLATTAQARPWSPCHYPHLHTPHSPSLVLQWTQRDEETETLSGDQQAGDKAADSVSVKGNELTGGDPLLPTALPPAQCAQVPAHDAQGPGAAQQLHLPTLGLGLHPAHHPGEGQKVTYERQ